MTKEQFFDWLSGYFDICEPDRIGVVETQTIKDHIDLVRGVEKLPPAPAMTWAIPLPVANIKKGPYQDGNKTVYEFGDLAGTRIESNISENLNVDEPAYPKSSGGRGRPTIEAPPPPVKVFPQDYPALNPVEYLKGSLPKLPYYC